MALGAAWMWRERIEPQAPPFVVVAPPAGAGDESSERGSVREEATSGTVDFTSGIRQRLEAEARRTERQIARLQEAARREEAEQTRQLAARPQTQAETETRTMTPTTTRTTASEASARATSYEAFRRENPLPRAGSPNGASPRVRAGAGDTSAGAGRATAANSSSSQPSQAEANAMDRYFDDLIARLRESHRKPGGLSDLLSAEVRFTVAADGGISRVELMRPSGDANFDRSVLEAFARVRLPARPDGRTDVQRLTFRMKER